ncbi:MAG TPA: TonB-dependent receptor [Candidatus Koribacter sp.]|jgi:outer membrane receptor protein involved in Fe transport
MRGFVRIAALAALVCVAAVCGWAQGSSAELQVTVKDARGGVINGATVTARNEAQNFERTGAPGREGEYIFQAVPPGVYKITVSAAGFAKIEVPNLRLTVGQVANLPVEVQVAAVNETVNVSSEAQMVETQRTGSASTVDQVQIDNLPINGRNYINFALTNSQLTRDDAPSIGAAPTSGINVSGQRARSNLVTVDGANAVDNSVNGVRSTVSQDAVQEFQLQTNGYNAEYGQAAGGVINIVTKSGSNDFHGDVFGYLRNRDIQAVNPFSTIANPAYTRVQAGFTAGGAIKKDKTFYFLSYETTRRHESGYSSIGADNFGFQNFDFTPFGVPIALPLTPQQIGFINGAVATGNGSFIQQAVQYGLLAGSTSVTALTGKNPLYNLGELPTPYMFTPIVSGVANTLPASYVAMNSLVGNFPIFEGTSLWSARLDQQVSANNQLSLRVGVSPSTVTGIQVNAQGPQNFGQNAWSRTSDQTYRDFNITAQDTWTLGNNKINEFRFQYARRGLLYNYASEAPGGSDVAINIPGYAFFGREPFSFVRRTEQRYEGLDNFTWTAGKHTVKFGADVNFLPLRADFSVNFGGLYDFGSVTVVPGAPALNPVQAYGLGIPQDLVQGVGSDHDAFTNLPVGVFLQDSWRVTPKLTLNYGVRYDVEFTPTFAAATPLAASAQNSFGITQGIPRDFNNVAPRIGFAWDPKGDGKTAIRGSYGIFYDHPLLALAFDSNVADATKDAQIVLFGGAPSACNLADPIGTLTATNAFQGNLACLPPSFTYLPNQQRFNPTPGTNSVWVNQNFMTGGPGGGPVPLAMLPFGYPTAKNFVYAYSEQANFTIEHDFGHGYDLSVQYNFNGGHHLNRPININAARGDLATKNLFNYISSQVPGGCPPTNAVACITAAEELGGPLDVNAAGVGPAGPYVPAAVVSFFRPSGFNPTLSPYLPAGAQPFINSVLQSYGLGGYGTIPFSDIPANFSNGSSVYHGLTVNLEKRFSQNYQFLASYTWSHAIDDSTDLQSPLSPQDNNNPAAERSNSLFDERHRFVFSGVYNTGEHKGGAGMLYSNWVFAPIIEIASGRPFNIISGFDQNFDFGSTTDRPMAASAGQTDPCGDVAAPSKFSPTGYLIPTCYLDVFLTNGVVPNLNGNIGRNVGTKPYNVFNDLRVSRSFQLTERIRLEGIMDVFNLANKFNVSDVNPIWNQAGTPTSADDPRQFQFALRVSW